MLTVGEQAPPFELPDLAGKNHRLTTAVAQGPVLAVFWKPSCGTCDLAFPYFQRLVDVYPSDRWQLLAVSQDSAVPSADFANQYSLTFPVLIEGEGWPASRLYDPEATPTFFLIAPGGTIEMTSVGFYKDELNEVARRLAEHLNEPARVIAEADDGNPPFRPG